MGYYKYRFVKEEGWRFELLPNNSSTYVGRSGSYATREDALTGLQNFKSYLAQTKHADIPLAEKCVIQNNQKRYLAEFCFSPGGETFCTRPYYHHSEVKKGLARIFREYLAGIRSDLDYVK